MALENVAMFLVRFYLKCCTDLGVCCVGIYIYIFFSESTLETRLNVLCFKEPELMFALLVYLWTDCSVCIARD